MMEEQISKIEKKLEDIETILETHSAESWDEHRRGKVGAFYVYSLDKLIEEKRHLREEKRQLREEKIQLREKERQLREEKNLLLAQKASPAERPRSPLHFDKVFIIAQATNASKYVDLLGTCFAITARHVITAHHNLTDQTDNIMNPYQISRIAKKISDNNSLDNPLEVVFRLGDAIDDWAILEFTDPLQQFANFFPVCELNDLPDTSMQTQLKSFYAPIGQYRTNAFRELRIWHDDYKPVLQYEDKKILLNGGLYRGSCGAPYIDRGNRVVALHLSSMHEGREISKTKKKRTVEDLEDYMTDQSDVHSSIREGLVLALVPKILEFIATN